MPADKAVTPERFRTVHEACSLWAANVAESGGRDPLLSYRHLSRGTLDLGPGSGVSAAAIRELLASGAVRLARLFPVNPGSGPLGADTLARAHAIRSKAAQNSEQRGLQTLFVALGLARWRHPRATTPTAAPVLLQAARFVSAGEDLLLEVEGEPRLNPALVRALFETYGITLPLDIPATLAGFDSTEPGALPLFAQIGSLAATVPGFTIDAALVLGNFPAATHEYLGRMEACTQGIAAHDLVAALAGDADAQAALSTRPPAEERSTGLRVEDYLVLEADTAQSRALETVLAGADLAILAAPGTGRTQTIANIAAALAIQGKRVLLVAEKRATLDDVLSRLRSVGLDALVGAPDGTDAGTPQAATNSAETPPTANRPWERCRDALDAHALALHQPRPPWNLSVYQARAGIVAVPVTHRSEWRLGEYALARLDPGALDRACDDLQSFIRLGGLDLELKKSPWYRALTASSMTSPDQADEALSLAGRLAFETLPAAVEMRDAVALETGLRFGDSLGSWVQTFGLLDRLAALLEDFSPDLFKEPLDPLYVAIQPAERSGAGRLRARARDPRFRQALRTMQSHCRRPSARSKDFVRGCGEARALLSVWREQTGNKEAEPKLPSDLPAAKAVYQSLRRELQQLAEHLGTADLGGLTPPELTAKLGELVDDPQTLQVLPHLYRLRSALRGLGLAPLLDELTYRDLDADAGAECLRYVWLSSVLEQVSAKDPRIGGFHGPRHSMLVEEFRRLDRRILLQNRARAREACAAAAEPLCVTLSPLNVPVALPPDSHFDVAIFDEAESIALSDAILALARAERAVVVGDPRGLTAAAYNLAAEPDDEADGRHQLDEAHFIAPTRNVPSLLDSITALLPRPGAVLDTDHRSHDERLAAFTNAHFHSWSLNTFPGTLAPAFDHVLVPHGQDEAEHVVQLVLDHARTRPETSLGVVALGPRQADRIALHLTKALANDRRSASFFAPEKHEPFFIKTPGQAQGESRDTVILSIGYGSPRRGTPTYSFGPLNLEGGERWLNVAITRARSSTTVVSSFTAAELDVHRLKAEGARLLRLYLAYAEGGGRDSGLPAPVRVPLDTLEQDLVERAAAAGLTLTPRYGLSGRRVDFAVAHPSRPERMVLAVETDGPAYGAFPGARDRDLTRPERLERCGWTVHRVWSADWLERPELVVAKILKAYERAAGDGPWTDDSSPDPAETGSAESSVVEALLGPDTEPDAPAESPAPDLDDTLETYPGDLLHEAEDSAAPARIEGRPLLVGGSRIDDYSQSDLVALVLWLESDGTPRSHEELLRELTRRLGFKRRGPRITRALEQAIDEAHRGSAEPRTFRGDTAG